jgi:hypothetical protein
MVQSGSRFLRCLRVHNLVWSLRVPGVYLTWANQVFLAFFTFRGVSDGWAGEKKRTAPKRGGPHKLF